MMDAIAVYRERFRASEVLAQPHVMLGVNVVVAETDEEARSSSRLINRRSST